MQTENTVENEFLSLEDEMLKTGNQTQTEIETETQEENIKTEEPEPEPEPEIKQQIEPEPEIVILKQTEPEKGKRGRKAGGKNRPKEQTAKESSSSSSEPTAEGEIFGEKPQPEPEPEKTQAEPAQAPKQLFAVSGEMLLGAIDFTAPLIITTIGGMIDKDIKKIKVESLQLEEVEKKTLLPAAEAVAREHIRLSAVEMLISGLLIIYTGKMYQAVSEIKKSKQ